jgi:hypothetical protein
MYLWIQWLRVQASLPQLHSCTIPPKAGYLPSVVPRYNSGTVWLQMWLKTVVIIERPRRNRRLFLSVSAA